MSACGCGDSFCNECNGASRLDALGHARKFGKLDKIQALLVEWESRQPPKRDGKPGAEATLQAIRDVLEGRR